MNYGLTYFVLLLKRCLRRPSLLFLMLCIPLLSLWYHQSQATADNRIQVALYCIEPDTLTQQLLEDLTASEGLYHFYQAASSDELKQDVAARRAECGYLITSDLTTLLDHEDYRRAISIYRSSATALDLVINEIVYASLWDHYGRIVLQNYLKQQSADNVLTYTPEEVNAAYQKCLEESTTFTLHFSGGNGSVSVQHTLFAIPLRGLLTILIFTAGMAGMADYRKDRRNGCFARISYAQHAAVRLFYAMVPALCFAVVSLICLSAVGLLQPLLYEAMSMLFYLILVSLFAAVFSSCIKNDITYYATLPLLLAGCLIFSPVFIDLSEYLPVGNILNKLFIPTYYLKLF